MLKSVKGTDNNTVKIGGKTTLYGDKDIALEKHSTIISFPGGDIEIARCSTGEYWIHVAIQDDGLAIDCRVDGTNTYDLSKQIGEAIKMAGVNHIAFLIGKK